VMGLEFSLHGGCRLNGTDRFGRIAGTFPKVLVTANSMYIHFIVIFLCALYTSFYQYFFVVFLNILFQL